MDIIKDHLLYFWKMTAKKMHAHPGSLIDPFPTSYFAYCVPTDADSYKLGKIDLQGPMSGKVLKKALLNPDAVFEDMVYFSFKGNYLPNSLAPATVKLTP
jgi:hypothetical protein